MAYINNSTILSGLTVYVDQLSMSDILTEAVYASKTLDRVSIQTGVKGKEAINLITSNPIWTAATCGLQAGTGSVTLSQQTITVSDISQLEDICLVGDNTLSKYWTGALQPKGINQEELTPKNFAKAYIADKMAKTAEFVEHIIWEGAVTSQVGTFSSASGMNLADGFLYQINYNTAVSSLVVDGFSASLTEANAISVVKYMVDKVPQAIADMDLTLYCSLVQWRKISNALIAANNYHFTNVGSTEAAFEITFPYAQNLKIVATTGLVGRNDLVLTYDKNLYVGIDGEHDYEQFKVWFSQDLNAVRFRSQFRIGTAIAYPQFVVYAHN